MKTATLFISLFSLFLLLGCARDTNREELPGIQTTISGNVKDYHRNINISNFEVKLIKVWSCGVSGNLTPLTCDKEVAKVITDANGNYTLKYNHNLRNDESYRLVLNSNSTDNYRIEYVLGNNSFYENYDTQNLIPGQTNVLNINAWKPITIKFNLNVLNNHTPPLYTGIQYNGIYENYSVSTSGSSNTFEIKTRPNANVKIKFWYVVNSNTSTPIYHYAPEINYQTNENNITELSYTINCNDF